MPFYIQFSCFHATSSCLICKCIFLVKCENPILSHLATSYVKYIEKTFISERQKMVRLSINPFNGQ